MTNVNQFQSIAMSALTPGAIFKYSPDGKAYMFIEEDNGVEKVYKTVRIDTGDVYPYNEKEHRHSKVFVAHNYTIQYLDANGDVFYEGETQMDIIVEGMEQDLETMITLLDSSISMRFEELRQVDPNYHDKLADLLRERHRLYDMAKDIRSTSRK